MIVKVCGVRTAEIAECAVEAGADWVGLMFEPRSPRYADGAAIDSVRAAVGGRAELVGVMVAPTPESCASVARRHRLSAVQLHGEVDPEIVLRLDVPVIRAVNPVSVQEALTLQWWPDCLLMLDSPPSEVSGLPGGTGVRLDPELAAEVAAHRPVILAGGLTPDTVADAILRVRPQGVDASSGLESSPGVKDPGRVRDFVAAARDAFARLAEGEAPGTAARGGMSGHEGQLRGGTTGHGIGFGEPRPAVSVTFGPRERP